MRRGSVFAAVSGALLAAILTLSVPAVADSVARAVFAKDAGKVDGYNAAALSRIAGGHRSAADPLLGDGTIVTTTIRVPASGYLSITASSDASNVETILTPTCFLAVGGTVITNSIRRIDHTYTAETDCQTNAFGAVTKGEYLVTLEAAGADSSTRFGASSVAIVFSPFGAAGKRSVPSSPLLDDPEAPTVAEVVVDLRGDGAVTKRV